jgi:hypothetical protein
MITKLTTKLTPYKIKSHPLGHTVIGPFDFRIVHYSHSGRGEDSEIRATRHASDLNWAYSAGFQNGQQELK